MESGWPSCHQWGQSPALCPPRLWAPGSRHRVGQALCLEEPVGAAGGRQAGRGCGVSRGQPGRVSQRRRLRSTGQGVAAREPQGEGGGGTLVPAVRGWGPPHPEKAPSHPPWAPPAFRARDHPCSQIQKDLSRVGSRCWLGWWGALLGHPQITLWPSGRIPGRSGLRVDWLGWPPRQPEAPHPPEAASLPGWASCRSAQALVAEWAEGSWLRNHPQGSSVQPPSSWKGRGEAARPFTPGTNLGLDYLR